MTPDEFIGRNHRRISDELWAKVNMPRCNLLTDRYELIADLYLHLVKKWESLRDMPEEELVAYSMRVCYNYARWHNSAFNKRARRMPNGCELHPESIGSEDNSALDAPEHDRAYVLDLESTYTDRQVSRIMAVRKIAKALTGHERILYDMHFNQMMSYRTIAEAVKLPPNSIYDMLAALKSKIKLMTQHL